MSETEDTDTQHDRTETALRGLEILRLLQWGKPQTARGIADELGVSVRTTREYIGQLRRAGINIKSGPGFLGAYWIDPGEQVYPMMFTEEEVEVILQGLTALRAWSVSEVSHPGLAQSLAMRIAESIPVELRERGRAERAELEKQVGRGALYYLMKQRKEAGR